MSIDLESNRVICDFCGESSLSKVEIEKFGRGWSWGQRRMVHLTDACYAMPEIKHACPFEKCKKKLEEWTKS